MRASSAVVVFVLAACTAPPTQPRDVAVAPRPDVSSVHALLLNGGATKPQNFRSHLLHVQQLVRQLEAAGVDRSRITIFSADGEDPDADVAQQDLPLPLDFWLIDSTRLEQPLRPPIAYTNTEVDGLAIRPATKAALTEWFTFEGRLLRPGDELLLYVTDHGTKNTEDTSNNRISLWGRGASLSVQELSALAAGLDPGVRVVSVMSQCYSGSFGELVTSAAGTDRPPGNVCGFFSSTADRPAYGCYPENRGRDNVGHSFHFLEALATTGSLVTAHEDVLVSDATPDVPLRSSDLFLERLLQQAADARKLPYATLVDQLLGDAWHDRARWEHEVRLLDRIGAAFGVFSPRSLQELDDESARVEAMAEQLETHGTAWRNAAENLARVNLDRFAEATPTWKARLTSDAMRALSPAEVATLRPTLLEDMVVSLAADPVALERFDSLREKTRIAKALDYRMEVRQGVMLRMRAVLASVAGRTLLASADPVDQATHDALRRCEALSLPPTPIAPDTELARAQPFPVLADDVLLADTVLPAWMGIQFRQVKDAQRAERRLAEGASSVMMVYDDSPAKAAGIEEGDIILGPPNAPFDEKEQVREWIMRSQPNVPVALEILRGDARRRVDLIPKAMPRKWPTLPGPPKVGSAAPPLHLTPYHGDVHAVLAGHKPRLLFFWATWCAICKAAVPELLAYAEERATQVIAITDETAVELDPFFRDWKDAFVPLVATDESRSSFRAYGVSGTPTFILIDADGMVQAAATGYSRAKGLPVEGWHWARAAAP